MRNIWVKIGLMAAGIFAVGMVIRSVFHVGRDRVSELMNSSSDIRIPLMGIVPFNLGDQHLGDLRRLTLLRDAPDHVTSVKVEARLADSATTAPLKDCAFLTVSNLTVDGSANVRTSTGDKNTRFTCVTDTTGLGSFGTVEIVHQQGGEPTTLVRTLVLTPTEIQAIRESMSSHRGLSAEQRARLQSMRDSLESMGDSIRAAAEASTPGARTHETAIPTPPPTPARSTHTVPRAPTARP